MAGWDGRHKEGFGQVAGAERVALVLGAGGSRGAGGPGSGEDGLRLRCGQQGCLTLPGRPEQQDIEPYVCDPATKCDRGAPAAGIRRGSEGKGLAWPGKI